MAQRRPGRPIAGLQPHQDVDVRRTDAEIEGRFVELLDSPAARRRPPRAKGDFRDASRLLDDRQALCVVQRSDLQRPRRLDTASCSRSTTNPGSSASYWNSPIAPQVPTLQPFAGSPRCRRAMACGSSSSGWYFIALA